MASSNVTASLFLLFLLLICPSGCIFYFGECRNLEVYLISQVQCQEIVAEWFRKPIIACAWASPHCSPGPGKPAEWLTISPLHKKWAAEKDDPPKNVKQRMKWGQSSQSWFWIRRNFYLVKEAKQTSWKAYRWVWTLAPKAQNNCFLLKVGYQGDQVIS